MHNRLVVSVIVPTHNSGKTIGTCLESIRNQSYPDIESIVVDEASTDETVRIAEQFADKMCPGGLERSAKRNQGAAQAKGQYLFFIDSDMELTDGVIEQCVAAALRIGAQAVIVPEISIGEGFWAKCKAFERSLYVGDDAIEAARFFSRELFERLGGYDEAMVGAEDWDIQARAKEQGAKVARVSSHIAHHEGRLSPSKTAAKKYAYSAVFDAYRRRHPDVAAQQFTVFRAAYLRNWRRMLRDPILAAGFVLMKFCEGTAAIAGTLLRKKEVDQ